MEFTGIITNLETHNLISFRHFPFGYNFKQKIKFQRKKKSLNCDSNLRKKRTFHFDLVTLKLNCADADLLRAKKRTTKR